MIKFTIEEGAIHFDYEINNKKGEAYLQLPDTPDSVHTINGDDYDSEDDEQREVYEALVDFFFDSFDSVELAAASALLSERIEKIQEIKGFYVAFTEEGNATLIKESKYKDYYNKAALFDIVDYSDLQIGEDEFLDEAELIEEAKKLSQ